METLEAGAVLQGKYRIRKILGRGGMGAVYLALAEHLDKTCAVKELVDIFRDSAEREKAVAQFRVEAKLLANLHHPRLPRVMDCFEEGGRHYLVMDFIDGSTLKDVVEQAGAPMAVERIVAVGMELASILDFLHSQEPPVIFRDLKPSNVMIDAAGVVKLIDFGISKLFFPADATRTGAKGFGSPGFCAPEQYGLGSTDARSDVYSLGAILFFMAAGTPPPDAVALAGGFEELSFPSQVTPHLGAVIRKAMAIKPANRFPSMGSLRERLSQAAVESSRDGGQTSAMREESDAAALRKASPGETPSRDREERARVSPGERPGFSVERVRAAFRAAFGGGLRWREESHEGYECVFSSGLLEKSLLFVRYLPVLDERAFLEEVEAFAATQRALSAKILQPSVKFYHVCLGGAVVNPYSIRHLAGEHTTASGVSLRRRFVIPVDMEAREVFDGHIAESHKDSNRLDDVFLNIRIAVSNI